MKKGGFYLSEIMVYVAIAAFVLLIFFKQSLFLLFKAKAIHEHAQLNNKLYITLFNVESTLRLASRRLGDWKKMTELECIWSEGSLDKGLVFHKGILYLIKGVYKDEYATWKKKKRTPLLRNVDNCKIDYAVQHNELDCITIMLTCALSDGYIVNKTINIFPQTGRRV